MTSATARVTVPCALRSGDLEPWVAPRSGASTSSPWRGGLMRLLPRWLSLALAIGMALSALGMPGRPVLAQQGQGDCSEPNNDFQTACFIGPGAQVSGTLEAADDIDAYRFETLDFGAHVQLALLDP